MTDALSSSTVGAPERAEERTTAAGGERVVLCGPDGAATGTALKSEVHGTDTPLHLAFSCHIFDHRGRVLVTRRARDKATFAGVRTNSCCGHPAPGEPITDAVTRRVKDELGIDVDDLTLVLPAFRYRAVAADGIVENELCPVFRARTAATALHPDPAEVDDAWWDSWESFTGSDPDGDPMSSWAREQIIELDRVGPDPTLWPAADPRSLPAAARPPAAPQ
jgi:isopentenyl-diphosphate delta-isomerase